MQEAEKEEQSINTSCNLTTFGCLRSFKVEISLFICDIITVDQSQSLDSKSMIFKKQNTNLSPERFIKDNQLKPRSEAFSFCFLIGTHFRTTKNMISKREKNKKKE